MKIRTADYIADFLVKNGITHLFSVPGGGAMHLNDAFGHKEGLHVIYDHHEQACTIAAEGFFRAFGKLGAAVCVTTGPGGTNALTGVMGSWVDSIPMIVISGQVRYDFTVDSVDVPIRQLGDQEFNIIDCVRCMTKYAVMVKDPLKIRYHLQKAFFKATHGRPGPVWLDIPLDVQGAEIETDDLLPYDEAEDAAEIAPLPDRAQLRELLDRIAKAKRPVIMAGDAIHIAGAEKKFLQLVDKLKIPVLTAWNSHDLITDDNPYNGGRPGSGGTRGGNIVMQSCDLMLSLGCRLSVRQTSFNPENFIPNAYLACVDIDQAEMDKPTIHPRMKIRADIRDVLDMLLGMEYDEHGQHAAWVEHALEVNRKYPVVLEEYRKTVSPINPYVFLDELGKALPEGQLTVTGNGTACAVTFQTVMFKKGQRMFHNSGSATMGYGLPAAIGACFANGNRPTVCLEGDGSIQMNLQELQTVVYHKLNLKIFWLNNEGYHSMRQTQTNLFHANFSGVDKDSGISFPSAKKIAAAYDLPYFCIESTVGLQEKLQELLARDGAFICEVLLDKRQFFAPKLSSKVYPDGTIVSPSLEDMYPFIPEEELKKDMWKD